MADNSNIEWTTSTWNPLAAMGQDAYSRVVDVKGRWNGHVELIETALDKPLHWKKPRMIFVDSMSDLFHSKVPGLFILRVLNVMFSARQHTFQVLTKRPERMMDIVNSYCDTFLGGKPMPNVWFMTSVENQAAADERIPYLVRTKAVVRGLSCEPLLGMVDLQLCGRNYGTGDEFVNWVIAGGESGPKARAMDPAWARSLRDQCVEAGVPFFFKQWGGVNKKIAGRELDGKTWSEMPR